MITRMRAFSVWLVLGGWTSTLWAEEPRIVLERSRIVLADLVRDVPEALESVDLGPAPLPGKTRLMTRQDIAERLRSLGVSGSRLDLPTSVRVESKAELFTPAALTSLVEGPLRAALPAGVRLERLLVKGDQLLSPDIRVGHVRLPRFAPEDGMQSQTATVELLWGAQVVMRLPVLITVQVVSTQGSELVPRGSTLTLVIARGNVRVSASAETLSPARVGQEVVVRVGTTKKTISAKLTSTREAEVQL